MGLGDLKLLDNLVYGIFGSPLLFSLFICLIFLYFSTVYNMPKWINIIFFIPFGVWLGFYYLPSWAMVSILLFIGIIAGNKLFKSFNK